MLENTDNALETVPCKCSSFMPKFIKKVRCSQLLSIFGHRAFFFLPLLSARKPVLQHLGWVLHLLMLADTKHWRAGRGECLRCKLEPRLFLYYLPTSATFP